MSVCVKKISDVVSNWFLRLYLRIKLRKHLEERVYAKLKEVYKL